MGLKELKTPFGKSMVPTSTASAAAREKSRGKSRDAKKRSTTRAERQQPEKELAQRHSIQNMILQKQAILERLQNAQASVVDRSGQKLRTG